MKSFWSIYRARNREFYRDKGSLAWTFAIPLLIVFAVNYAFSERVETFFEVGIIGSADQLPAWDFLHQPYTDIIYYGKGNVGEKTAMKKLLHHELDLLIRIGTPHTYWLNDTSPRGQLIADIIGYQDDHQSVRNEVSGQKIRYVDWAIPGIIGMTIMFGGLFGAGYVIVRYRKNGVLKRLQATPISKTAFLSAQIFSRMTILLMSGIIIFTGSHLWLNLVMMGNYGLLFLVLLVGSGSLIALGLVCSSRTNSEELAGGLLNFFSFPMLLLSELWFSLDSAPEWMQWLSGVLPLTHMVAAARAVMLDGAHFLDIAHHLIILTVMWIVFLAIAVSLFRWHND